MSRLRSLRTPGVLPPSIVPDASCPGRGAWLPQVGPPWFVANATDWPTACVRASCHATIVATARCWPVRVNALRWNAPPVSALKFERRHDPHCYRVGAGLAALDEAGAARVQNRATPEPCRGASFLSMRA